MISHFSTLIVDFVEEHAYYAHVVVFLLAMSEAIPVVGTVVPGSTLVIAISALATSADANPWILLVSAFAGAVAGDGFSYWLGRHYHREILNSWPINRYQQFVARSENFIKRYGLTSVFLARFTAIIRAFVPLIAGILQMPPRQFYAANILSAIAWAPAHVFPGVLLAIALQFTGTSVQQRIILVIAGLIIVTIFIYATHWYFRPRL
jgi:membrane protein DedA with SNARE-associated domain